MLYTLRSSGKKYAYDSTSGAVIPLNTLSFKMLSAIVPPLSELCPTSLRYELAKFDSNDVDEAYEHIYSLFSDKLIYGKENGTVALMTEGEYACPNQKLGEELLSMAISDAPSSFLLKIIGDDFSSELKQYANKEANALNKSII